MKTKKLLHKLIINEINKIIKEEDATNLSKELFRLGEYLSTTPWEEIDKEMRFQVADRLKYISFKISSKNKEE